MCTKDTLQMVLSELYTKLKDIFGNDLDKVILYGSYARGDNDEYSDIDVMVLVACEEEEIKTLDDKLISCGSQLCLDYDVVLSVYIKNKAHFDYWKEDLPYYRNIVTEGIEISA